MCIKKIFAGTVEIEKMLSFERIYAWKMTGCAFVL